MDSLDVFAWAMITVAVMGFVNFISNIALVGVSIARWLGGR